MDKWDSAKRSWVMSRIRSKDTKPEVAVRSLLHRAGFRFRLYVKDLPGKPDIVLPKYRTVIEIRGCFWHKHEGCKDATIPSTRRAWWLAKLHRNAARDRKNLALRERMGWRTIVIWTCSLKNLPLTAGGYAANLSAFICSDCRPCIEIPRP